MLGRIRNSELLNHSSSFAVLFEITICIFNPLESDLKYCTLLPNGIARSLSNFMKLSNTEDLDLFLRKYTTLNLEHTSVNLAIEVSYTVLNLISRSEPLRAQRSTIVHSILFSKQHVWSTPQSENTFKSFFLPSSPTGSY